MKKGSIVIIKALSSFENIWMLHDKLIKQGLKHKVLDVDVCEAQHLSLLLHCREASLYWLETPAILALC